MRLTIEEVAELKSGTLSKAWRFEEPKHADIGKVYTAVGQPYTILDVQYLQRTEVWQKHREAYNALGLTLDDKGLWVIEIAFGDLTDRPRLLAASGGDYTHRPSRAMKDTIGLEPEALNEKDLEVFARTARALSDQAAAVKTLLKNALERRHKARFVESKRRP